MHTEKKVTGNIFMFHAFDVGDEIDLDSITDKKSVKLLLQPLARYFKNYHTPLAVKPPQNAGERTACDHAKIHNFGVISLRYRVPFATTISELRSMVVSLDHTYEDQSLRDAQNLFEQIKQDVKQPRFFQEQSSYMLIQMNELPGGAVDLETVKTEYGDLLISLLRFETASLSAYLKDEILEDAFSYYHKDLIIIDTYATILCDDEYDEVLDLFEFANVQHVELQFFDRVLDKQLNSAYEQDRKSPHPFAYLPFIGVRVSDPVGDLGKLKVDISVITDRLETSIKLASDAYISQLYRTLSDRLDLDNWKVSISRKLEIIHDIGSVYQHKLEVIREDLLTCCIIVLILLELLMGILHNSH